MNEIGIFFDWLIADTSPIELVASAIALVGAIATAFLWLRRVLSNFSEARRKARELIDIEIERYKETGTNISGRNDLGFLVLFEINALRHEETKTYRSSQQILLLIILGVLIFTFGPSTLSYYWSEMYMAFGFFLIIYGMTRVASSIVRKKSDYLEQELIGVWKSAVQKRYKDN